MKTSEGVVRFYKAEPRTPAEAAVFTVMTVTAEGAEIYLCGGGDGVLRLHSASQLAVLEELVTSARRRMLEFEQEDLQRGAAAAAVGAAGEAVGRGSPG